MNLIAPVLAAAMVHPTLAGLQPLLITEWNFNGTSAATVPGSPASPTASFGAGTASLIGGTTAVFQLANNGGGSSDPLVGTSQNFGWQTENYAAQGTASGTTGVRFAVSTAGMTDIVVEWDTRHSNTSSRFVQFQYSIDGLNFTSAGLVGQGIFEANATPEGGDVFYNDRRIDLSGILGVADNANFAFQVMAVFAPGQSLYLPSTAESDYLRTGKLRYDMVQVFGSVIPGPGALAVLAAFSVATPRRRG